MLLGAVCCLQLAASHWRRHSAACRQTSTVRLHCVVMAIQECMWLMSGFEILFVNVLYKSFCFFARIQFNVRYNINLPLVDAAPSEYHISYKHNIQYCISVSSIRVFLHLLGAVYCLSLCFLCSLSCY